MTNKAALTKQPIWLRISEWERCGTVFSWLKMTSIEKLRTNGPLAWLLFVAAVVAALVGLAKNAQWFKSLFLQSSPVPICSAIVHDVNPFIMGAEKEVDGLLGCLSDAEGKRVFLDLEIWAPNSNWEDDYRESGANEAEIKNCQSKVNLVTFDWKNFDQEFQTDRTGRLAYMLDPRVSDCGDYLAIDLSGADIFRWGGPGPGMSYSRIRGFFRPRYNGDIRFAYYWELAPESSSPELLDEVLDFIED